MEVEAVGGSGGILGRAHLDGVQLLDSKSDFSNNSDSTNLDTSNDNNENSTAISLQDTPVKNEEHAHIIKPPQPPQPPLQSPGGNDNNSSMIENSDTTKASKVYRIGHSDNWACKDCKQKGDKGI